VLCRKVAAKRVEDGAEQQSVCSQVFVRQISQLANGALGDSLKLIKSVASASSCICSFNLGQNNPS